MALVEDHQAEARAEVIHVQARGVVSGHRERREFVATAAHDADVTRKARAQQIVPLAHEIQRRRHDQGATTFVVDGEHGHVALASTRRQHDDAAALGLSPSRQRFGLKGSRLTLHAEPALEFAVSPRLVVIRDARVMQEPHEIGVGQRRRAKAATARVPSRVRREREPFRQSAAQLQRSRRKAQRNGARRGGHGITGTGAPHPRPTECHPSARRACGTRARPNTGRDARACESRTPCNCRT